MYGQCPDNMNKISLALLALLPIMGSALTLDAQDMMTEYERAAHLEIQWMEKFAAVLSCLGTEDQKFVLRYMADFEDANGHVDGFRSMNHLDKVRSMAWNMLRAYRIGYRFSHFHPKLAQIVPFTNVTSPFSKHGLFHSSTGFLRTCHTFNFDIQEISDGIVFGKNVQTKLNAEHCYDMAMLASEYQFMALSIQFLEVALVKAERDGSILPDVVKEELKRAIIKHDTLHASTDDPFMEEYSALFTRKIGPIHKRFPHEYKKLRISRRQECAVDRGDNIIHWDLCLAGESVAKIRANRFKCWLSTDTNPYWTLQPLKVEQHSSQPDVIEVHDLIREQMIATLKKLTLIGYPKKRGDFPHPLIFLAVKQFFMMYRIRDSQDERMKRVVGLMEKATGLNGAWGSPGKQTICNIFSPNDFFQIHRDSDQKTFADFTKRDDVIATMMIILEKAEIGGETTFFHNEREVIVKPERGSALIWYTLQRNGVPHEGSHHASCSLVSGRKWTVTKWFDYRDQFHKGKCGLKEDDHYEFPKPGKL